ncbi:MAG: LytR C-terminal domain-containing protein [Endomicrobia bacterium]|nr:LytR C-terminal domain-containing protein [Endomicrobiia bacterium]
MQKRTKTALAVFAVILPVLIAVAAFVIVRAVKSDEISQKLFSGKPLYFTALLYGTEKALPGKLEAFAVYYDRESGLLKILSMNTDAVVFRKKTRAKSFRDTFFEDAKKDVKIAVSNFYADMFEALNNTFTPDFYVNMDYETFFRLVSKDKSVKELASEESFATRDAQCVNQLERAEALLALIKKRTFSSVKNFNANINSMDTNLTKSAFLRFALHFRMHNAKIMFCAMPVKYARKRVEPDKVNTADFLANVFYAPVSAESKKNNTLVEVMNASQKPRMAEKASWVLREQKFDVLDWSNFKTAYAATVIKDYCGDFAGAEKIAKALGCGKIIVSYDAKSYYNFGVFIGSDCAIYDKLDKRVSRAEAKKPGT